MIEEGYASNYLPLLAAYLQGKPAEVKSSLGDGREYTSQNGVLFAAVRNGAYAISEYGNHASPEAAPDDSVAIVSITGPITKHDQYCGPAGMKTKSDLLARCYENPKIKGIVLTIDSGGGEVYAGRTMMQTIARRNKGVVAFVDDFACSAAYGIAAACDSVTLNSEIARVGSIGTLITIADYTEYYKKLGINLIEIYASLSTDKNRDYAEAIKGNREPLQKVCDVFNKGFIAHIADCRKGKISEDQSLWNTGKVFFAKEAVKLGLADEIASLDNVINYFNT
jgi:signal peptide peptidase SppA